MTNTSPLPVTLQDILAARERIRHTLPETPLTYSYNISETIGRDIYLKWESKFRTGAFKERGALNRILTLTPEQKKQGVIAASAGNHALALSFHAAKAGVACEIIMPVNAPVVKSRRTKAHGANVILHGKTFADAYEEAMRIAKERGATFVSAFDDPAIIAGQGTCGLELIDQLPQCDAVIVPVGGGGLISGMAAALKARRPDIFILGVRSSWAERARSNPAEHAARGPLAPTTIADGIAVKTVGINTTPMMKALVDKIVAIEEPLIANALMTLLELEKSVVEGAGAVGLSAVTAGHLPSQFKHPVIVISGGNIDPNLLGRLIEANMEARGRILRLRVAVPDSPGSLHTLTGILAEESANVLQVAHDRSSASEPGCVEVSFMLEIRDPDHGRRIRDALITRGCKLAE